MSDRLITTTLGTIIFDTGVIPSGVVANPAPNTLQFNDSLTGWMGTKKHNDHFALTNTQTTAIVDNIHFATSDYIDLRDLVEEGEGLDNIVVNIQRQQELPYASSCWNLSPINAIYETLIVSQQPIPVDCIVGSTDIIRLNKLYEIGFSPVPIFDGASYSYVGVRADALVYVETRKYSLDGSQQWSSPDQMGQMNDLAPGDPAQSETRFTSDFAMTQRSVRGNPDLIVGPGLHVVRVFSCWNAERPAQAVVGANPADAPATEFQFNTMRLSVMFPAMTVNVLGHQRKLTDTEIAVWYSNILLE